MNRRTFAASLATAIVAPLPSLGRPSGRSDFARAVARYDAASAAHDAHFALSGERVAHGGPVTVALADARDDLLFLIVAGGSAPVGRSYRGRLFIAAPNPSDPSDFLLVVVRSTDVQCIA